MVAYSVGEGGAAPRNGPIPGYNPPSDKNVTEGLILSRVLEPRAGIYKRIVWLRMVDREHELAMCLSADPPSADEYVSRTNSDAIIIQLY